LIRVIYLFNVLLFCFVFVLLNQELAIKKRYVQYISNTQENGKTKQK